MAIRQIEEHLYECDRDTPLKELAKTGWISSVKLSRMEGLWGVRLLKVDIEGAMAADVDVLIKDSGPSRKYYYKKDEIVPILKLLQEYLEGRDKHEERKSFEYPVAWVRDFWKRMGQKVHPSA